MESISEETCEHEIEVLLAGASRDLGTDIVCFGAQPSGANNLKELGIVGKPEDGYDGNVGIGDLAGIRGAWTSTHGHATSIPREIANRAVRI